MPGRGNRPPAPALVLTAVASVQTGSAVATHLFASVGPSGAVLLRLGIGSALMLTLVRPWRLHLTRRLTPGALRAVAAYGLCQAGMNLSIYEALDRIPLGVAVTVEFLGPLTVALAGSRRVLDVVWALAAGAGVALLSLRGDASVSLPGIGFAALAGAFWAGYILSSARVGRTVPGVAGLAMALPLGAIVIAPLALPSAGLALLEPRVLVLGAAVAVLSTVLPYSLELAALRRMHTRVFGVLMSLEPAAAALAGLVLLDQTLATPQVAALGLVTAASVGATATQRQRGPTRVSRSLPSP